MESSLERLALLESNGVKQMVLRLREHAQRSAGDDARSVLLTLLTLGNRLPLAIALEGLTSRGRAAINYAFALPAVPFLSSDGAAAPSPDVHRYAVSIGRIGRVQLFPAVRAESERGNEDADVILGYIDVPTEIEDAVLEAAARADTLDAFYDAMLAEELSNAESAGELSTRLACVRDWVTHVEAVYFYVGQEAYGHCETLRNLVAHGGARGVLDNLDDRSVRDWTSAERVIVGALWYLYITGRAVRFEEFGGRQLSATSLYQWLLDACITYSAALGERFCPPPLAAGVYLFLAEQVRQLCIRCDESSVFRFRRVHGLTYLKSERLASKDLIPDLDQIPEAIERFTVGTLGVPSQAHRDHTTLLRAATLAAIDQDIGMGAGESVLARLIGAIVLSAASVTDSDYAMSSSLRNLSDLRPTPVAPALVRAARLSTSSFYCCCLPHPRLLPLLPINALSTMLWKVAMRMEFNRWHFIVGNFGREEVPDKRHYFYPPLLPDISSWSDQQHSGHAKAGVRYAVRAPGPPMFSKPFRLWGHDYRGFFDIRLVRQAGQPFTIAEMARAVQHSHYIGEVLATVREKHETSDEQIAIRSFTADWYARGSWRAMVAELTAGEPAFADLPSIENTDWSRSSVARQDVRGAAG